MGKIPYTLKLAKPFKIQGIPGFLDFSVQKSKNAPKGTQKNYNYTTGVISFLFYQKLAFFCKVAYFYVNPAVRKRQSPQLN